MFHNSLLSGDQTRIGFGKFQETLTRKVKFKHIFRDYFGPAFQNFNIAIYESDRGGSGIIFACDIQMKVPITGGVNSFYGYRYLAVQGKYHNLRVQGGPGPKSYISFILIYVYSPIFLLSKMGSYFTQLSLLLILCPFM